jgi:hypothetical protein
MIAKFIWNALKIIGIYRAYIVLNTYVKLDCYYWSQRLRHAGIPVVIIDHNFIQDISLLQRHAADSGINLIRLPYEPFFMLGALFFNEDVRDGSYQIDAVQESRASYNRLIRALFSFWKPQAKISCFLTPSDSFFWIREPVSVLREKGIPCLVIDKEGTISPHSMEHHSRQVADFFPLISDGIIVWSERQREFWNKTGVADEKILVAGQPRSDFFFDTALWMQRERLLPKSSRVIVFFTFETDAYAPVPGDHIWTGLRGDIHRSLIGYAGKFPDLLFVVKTHPQQQDRALVQAEFAATGLKNILVLHGPQISRHLIVHADLVIGFQTTALIEAMLAAKRVVYTEWSREVSENLDQLIPFHEARGIDVMRSRGEFEALLDGIFARDDYLVPALAQAGRKEFIDVYIPNADGNVSRRVMKHVREVIETGKTRRRGRDFPDAETGRYL